MGWKCQSTRVIYSFVVSRDRPANKVSFEKLINLNSIIGTLQFAISMLSIFNIECNFFNIIAKSIYLLFIQLNSAPSIHLNPLPFSHPSDQSAKSLTISSICQTRLCHARAFGQGMNQSQPAILPPVPIFALSPGTKGGSLISHWLADSQTSPADWS